MFKYPYGDSQQLNLDWILRKLKELEEAQGQQITEDLEVISNALISATFSSSNAYNRSDIVYHDGKLYRANVNIPAPGESWNPAHWNEILLGDTLSNVVTYLAALNNTQVFNSSNVPGTHTSDALNNLDADITQIENQLNTIQPEVDKIQQITDEFDFYNPNAAYRIANNQGQSRVGYIFNADNTITVNKNYSAYGSSYAFNDSLMLQPGKYNISAYVQTSNSNPSLLYPVRVKVGLSSSAPQYPTLTTTQGGSSPISQGDNAGWLTADFEITQEETFCFLIMPNSAAWDPLTISNLSITGLTAYDAEARTKIDNLNGAITSNPNIKFRSVGNSIMTGSVWVNGAADHLTEYHNSPYGIIAASLGIKQANVTHTMLSGGGLIYDAGNGSFYNYIVTNNLNLTDYDYLMTMLWTSDMYTKPIGTLNDTSSSDTLAGKVISLIEYLKTNYPKVNFILLGVPPTNYDTGKTGNAVFTGVYSNGSNIKQCDTLMHSLAEKYHFTFVDYEQWYIAYYYQNFTDGNNVHANKDDVYRLMGEYLANNVNGQALANNSFLKTLVLQSSTITGTYAGWRNMFDTDNPLIDESMTVVAIDAQSPKEIKTVNVSWKVVNGNVQIYGNFTDTGTTFIVALARTNKINNSGFYHVPSFATSSLILDTTISTSGEQTVDTYNSRKLSDYSMLNIIIGSAAKTAYATATITSNIFTQTGYVLNLSGLAGANYDVASGAIIKYDSDTSVKVTLTGAKAFTHFQITGTRII